MIRPRRVLAIAALLCAVGGPAPAVPFPDGDDNDLVNYEEAKRVFFDLSYVDFRKFDIDRDGELTRGQFAALNNFYDLVYRDR